MNNKIRVFSRLIGLAIFALIGAPLVASAIGTAAHVTITMETLATFQTGVIIAGSFIIASAFIPKGIAYGLFAEAPDVSALTTAFVRFGGQILKEAVNTLSIKTNGFYSFYNNVTAPLVLPKLTATGNPRPYRAADDTSGNDMDFTDRTLTTYASKWDFDFDFEKFHNTYLASSEERPYMDFMLGHMAEQYWAQINDDVVYLGDYDAAGTAAADIAYGWGTLIATDIAGDAEISVIATGAVNNTNAVTKHESILSALPAWARQSGTIEAIMSFAQFDNYRQHYRNTYGYSFNPRQDGFFYLDNTNIKLRPESFMGTSNRIIYSMPKNLSWGVKGNDIKVYATQRRNIIEVRPMIHIGFQIADTQRLFVNDQA